MNTLLTYVLLSILFFSTPLWSYEQNDGAKNVVKVTVRPLSQLVVSAKHNSPALVVSLSHTLISAEITGRVVKLSLREGDQVSKGEILAKIDCSDYRLARQQAKAGLEASKAQLTHAEKQYSRNLKLRNNHTIPQTLLDESVMARAVSKADLSAKKSLLKSTAIAIERCNIKAPFSGQITSKQASLGQLLMPGTPVVKILQSSALEIQADLSPEEIQSLKQSDTLLFSSMGQDLAVRLRAVIQEIKDDANTQEVRFELKESVLTLSAGSSGRLLWNDARRLLPTEYIVRRKGKLGVMIAQDNKAIFRTLPNAREGHAAVISLPSHTQIIDMNRHTVSDGQHIAVQEK